MKTSDLQGVALDWAVTTIEEPDALRYGVADWIEQRRSKTIGDEFVHRYHQSWSQGGPIIERERIAVEFVRRDEVDSALVVWSANKYGTGYDEQGPTPLVAAMRSYVASKLGDEVTIPEGLN